MLSKPMATERSSGLLTPCPLSHRTPTQPGEGGRSRINLSKIKKIQRGSRPYIQLWSAPLPHLRSPSPGGWECDGRGGQGVRSQITRRGLRRLGVRHEVAEPDREAAGSPLSRRSFEAAGTGRAAGAAAAVLGQIPLRQHIPVAADERLLRSRGSRCCLPLRRGRCRCRRSGRRASSAIARAARQRLAAASAGLSSILQSGWKAVKWSGTSAPRFSTIHRVIRVDLFAGIVLAGNQRGCDLEPDVGLVLRGRRACRARAADAPPQTRQ